MEHNPSDEEVRQQMIIDELRWRSDALEHSLNGFDIVGADGTFIYANRAYLRMWGYDTLDEILGTSPAGHCANPAVPEQIMNALHTYGEYSLEFTARRKDGSTFEVLMFAQRFTNSQGIEWYMGTSIDITERKRSDTTLRESEARYRLLAENISDVIWVLDVESGCFRYVSPSIERLRGYSVEEALAERLEDALTPDSRRYLNTVFPARLAAFQQGDNRAYTDELEQPCKDGTTRWVEVTSRFVPDELTGRLEVYGSSRDITERKKVETALRESETRLLLAQRCARLGYIEIDAPTQQVFWADEVFQILGYAPQAFTPNTESFFEHLHPDDTDWMRREIEQLLRNGQASQNEYRVVRPDGEVRWLYGRGEVFFDEHGQPLKFIGILQDITEGKQARLALEEERANLARRVAERTADLQIANAELARAARLKDEFLANMSHELRTPLNAVLGRCELLLESIYGPLTRRQTEAVRGIDASGRHLLELINDILDLSKIEAGKVDIRIGPVIVKSLCQSSMQMVTQSALLKQIDMTTIIDSQVEVILADERRLKQILVNLLTNAVKFTPEGGRVGLEVRGDRVQGLVTFSVWDTGIGIAAEDMAGLFQPFVQIDSGLNRQYAGTGLGLALVRRLAHAQHGSVAVESTPGRGSRFSVTLPWQTVAAEPAPVTLEAETTTPPAPLLRQALVIEDSRLEAEQLSRLLSELGARVEVHPQASGAFERAVAVQPDVIVLDILLPDEPGWEVLRRLKADPRTQSIPVIILSVVDQPAYGLGLGAVAYLVKPIERTALMKALQQIVTLRNEAPIEAALVIVAQEGTPPPRILLAEDNEEQIQILREYLQVSGYEVVVARNGFEALIRAQDAPPALIVMDIQMPGIDGLETIRRIRADTRLRSTPVIALTALAMPGDRERCLEAGADDYLTKPVSMQMLVATIATYLKH